jgi:hypothetical protein
MSFITLKEPSEQLEKYLDETKSILNNEYFKSNSLEDLVKCAKISGLYYDEKKHYVLEEDKKHELDNSLNSEVVMTINYKDVIRAYKVPRHIKKYILIFKPKKENNNQKFYDNLIPEMKQYFELRSNILMMREVSDENLENIIGKVLSLTSKEFYCDGYILYDRPVTKDKKVVKVKNKCAIIMRNGLYEYKTPETIKFSMKFSKRV